jgi:hypothetical protein
VVELGKVSPVLWSRVMDPFLSMPLLGEQAPARLPGEGVLALSERKVL